MSGHTIVGNGVVDIAGVGGSVAVGEAAGHEPSTEDNRYAEPVQPRR